MMTRFEGELSEAFKQGSALLKQLFGGTPHIGKEHCGVEAIAGHEPTARYSFSEQAGGAARIIRPPWGSKFTWYSSQGLCRAYDILSHMEIPTDWLWRDLAAQGKFALLTPPVASHEAGTTYIGNEHRVARRRFIF